MKNYIYIIAFALSQTLFAQQNQNVYLSFNSTSNELCNIPKNEQERYHGITKVKRFEKIKSNHHMLRFYICNELFLLDSTSKIDTCASNYFKKIKISDIWELKKVINKVNPLYPAKVFKDVYLIEKLNDSTIVKYKVKWQYYIE